MLIEELGKTHDHPLPLAWRVTPPRTFEGPPCRDDRPIDIIVSTSGQRSEQTTRRRIECVYAFTE
jgi:hypothetical protein